MVVHYCIVKFTSFQRDGRRCYEYMEKMEKMDSEVLTCLSKFIEYSPRLPFGIVAYAFTLFWTTYVETAVCKWRGWQLQVQFAWNLTSHFEECSSKTLLQFAANSSTRLPAPHIPRRMMCGPL